MLVYNSQTHKKEELEPIEPGKIRMYVCGPTVYDQIHIGNARTFLAFDVIRRYLMYKGYQVTFAQNLTDVDVHDPQSVDASVWQAVAGLYSVSEGDAEGELAWQTDALCAQTDPEAFFPEKGGSTRDAKRVCEACPVSGECLDYAMSNDEKFGIWGGLSERERRRLRRRGR